MSEEAKASTSKRLDSIEDLPTGMIIINEEGRVEAVNREFTRLVGMDGSLIVGELIFDMVGPSDIPLLLDLVRSEGMEEPKMINITWKNEEGYLFLIGSSLKTKGAIKRIICSFIMKENGSGIRSVPRSALEDLPFPVAILNKRLEPLFQNSATDEQISLVSKRKDPVKYPRKELKGLLMQALTEGQRGTLEVSVPMKDGERKFDVIVVPIHHGNDTTQVMEIWMDITPIESAGPNGSVLKGIGDDLIENSNAIIIGIDMEGKINIFNSGAKRALGYDPSEVEGTIWFDYLVDHDAEKGRLEVFQWNIGTGFRTQYESKVRASSGRVITILLENSVIFNNEGEVSFILMVGQDVTKTKKLEGTLRDQSEKLADAMEELMLYNDLMIHDMHNANAGILGYLELLDMDSIPEVKKKDYVKRALSEVKKSSSIIKDVKVMSLSRPNTGSEAVDLEGAFMNSISKWKVDPEHEKIKIGREGTELHVMADDLIEEAIIRILDNAVAHSKKKDMSIWIHVKRDHSKANLIPSPVHITFKDDGGSIPESMLEALLERPASTEWGSQMLGLYLVKRIVSNYNGLVWLERIKGGTELHMILSEAV